MVAHQHFGPPGLAPDDRLEYAMVIVMTPTHVSNQARGDEEFGKAHVRTAMNCWLRAANYYRHTKFWVEYSDPRRLEAFTDMEECLRKFMQNHSVLKLCRRTESERRAGRRSGAASVAGWRFELSRSQSVCLQHGDRRVFPRESI
jgi:hypothetical protein